MKLSLILFAVLTAVSTATPLQQVGVEQTQPEHSLERRDPIAQHHEPPDRPNACDKCDRVYESCVSSSEYCRTHNKADCSLYCSIEACDYQDCYKCGWSNCTHKKVLQADAQPNSVKRGEAQKESTVEYLDTSPMPVDEVDSPPNTDRCDKCDKVFLNCVNESEYCLTHTPRAHSTGACLLYCGVIVCDYQDCYGCGWTNCIRNPHLLDNEIDSPHNTDLYHGKPATREQRDMDDMDVITHLDNAIEARADCNSCKDHYNQCLDVCGDWWSPDKRPEQCYNYCEVDACKFQDCKKKCLTWSTQC